MSISIRDGRAVIPVPSGNKRKIHGIIQDESATGKTTFIEPAEVVEINNEVRELEYAERREVMRILVEMADKLRPYIDDLLESYRITSYNVCYTKLLRENKKVVRRNFKSQRTRQSCCNWR